MRYRRDCWEEPSVTVFEAYWCIVHVFAISHVDFETKPTRRNRNVAISRRYVYTSSASKDEHRHDCQFYLSTILRSRIPTMYRLFFDCLSIVIYHQSHYPTEEHTHFTFDSMEEKALRWIQGDL
jgi:hypothetical protein